ncbi:MAG: hypothetical protein DWH73_01010 [Planctomycetota bacterium]|nr:MAG: hypothetical protein DWH73_01010 [Planctomycetota bacterium]
MINVFGPRPNPFFVLLFRLQNSGSARRYTQYSVSRQRGKRARGQVIEFELWATGFCDGLACQNPQQIMASS